MIAEEEGDRGREDCIHAERWQRMIEEGSQEDEEGSRRGWE